MGARERLQSATWDSLDAMAAGYAKEAVEVARKQFRETLDYSVDALDRLDRILNRLSPAPDPLPPEEDQWLTTLWGSYLGETLRLLHGGEWTMSVYPGSDFAVPTLEVPSGAAAGPSRLYPMLKVHRRLALGAGESLPGFYAMVAKRLGPSAQ